MTSSLRVIVLLALLTTTACQPDESPLKIEHENLRKHAEKQESVILSLQEGNKVMQQQIDLLNKDLREAREQVERVMTERATLTAQLDAQDRQSKKLAADAQRVAEKVAQLAQALRFEEKGSAAEELPHAFGSVAKAAEEALGKNGYTIRISMKTDQKAAYVTDRKVSEPASLEVPGFRNQYLVSVQALSPTTTRVAVKADFERMAQGNRILPAGSADTSEIERRLIAEITRSLSSRKL